MMHDHDNTIAPAPATPPEPTAPTRNAWEVIEEVCHQRLSGELALVTAAPTATRVYMNNGLVYFAEQDGDESLAARLVISGALDDEQLRRGAIRLNGAEHLGRLFERDATIDRDAVELAIELITEMTLSEVADQAVRSFRTTMYRHHSSGINRWFSSQHTMEDEPVPAAQAAPALARPVAVADVEVAVPEVEPMVAALEAVVPAWVPEPVVQQIAEPVVVEPVASFDGDTGASVEAESDIEPPTVVTQEPEPVVEPELVPLASVIAPRAEPYRASLDLSDLVAAMGVGTGRALNPADDDRPVVKARMWAPSITPPEPVEPPPAVPEPFNRQVDPELESLIASLVPTSPVAPAANLAVAPAEHHADDAPDDEGVEWFALPSASTALVTAPLVEIARDPAVTIEQEVIAEHQPEPAVEPEPACAPELAPALEHDVEPEVDLEREMISEPETTSEPEMISEPETMSEPQTPMEPATPAMPELAVEALSLPTLPKFMPVATRREDSPASSRNVVERPTNDSLALLSALTPITPITVIPAPMVPVVSGASLATVHPIRDIPPMAIEPPVALTQTAYVIPELGSIPVPEDVAAAVRRAIAAIEAATTTTGPLPVTFGPLHVTSYAQQPVLAQAEPAFTAAVPFIQPVYAADGHVPPLMSLNDTVGSVAMTPASLGQDGQSDMSLAEHFAPPTPDISLSAATMPFPEIEFPAELPPVEELLSNPQVAPISNQRRGALRRLIDGIRRR